MNKSLTTKLSTTVNIITIKSFIPINKRMSTVSSTPKHQDTIELSYTDQIRTKLKYLSTKFYFKKKEVEILNDPDCFYNTLKQKISNAKERVFLATLYIGKSEDELVECISDALKYNSKLKVYFLLDGLRGTRESPSKCSAQLLSQLTHDYKDRVDIRLYKTPAYIGWKKALIPSRFDEALGLQHMKIYGFDNEVMLSGANLSNDYFTNRQDRYFLFKNKLFANYHFALHQLISSLSYKLEYSTNQMKYQLLWPSTNICSEPLKGRRKFIRKTSKVLSDFLHNPNDNLLQSINEPVDKNIYPTTVYPISQFSPLFHSFEDKSTEKPTILNLISCIKSPSINWMFTTGYFNMLPEIRDQLLKTPSNNSIVITASPYANGFFESKGISKHLPAAYLFLSKKFLKSVHNANKSNYIHLREWKKGVITQPGGWSYHAKGLWISKEEANQGKNESDIIKEIPFATVIGSSNYTKRAYSLDLESNAVIVTDDMELRLELYKELRNLLKNTKEINLEDFRNDKDRKIPTGVKVATSILGKKL
ncbi:hypothetical protein TPHA_0O00310 [Tetrapisispora phaffii CBS 4417]|uniref:CDP-diacylglycerol--glycerol-3-phosphate 3-phosphatidyltransferase n=1 Tax=Tetrapisispora phaffii (strain ATCC 24235 / CBS 4417 / NBRC 1672 / NRRL Y-8282 / UCD 70-5) TaxID=1071381 RepID=G8C1H5_TETPH|nr:hypothetical protein TPHA_0O00310 [Tetrapisispora phaffii CBS 4417]CCE66003.1 hypothetical protein TPHA_0O00310 [Tetrapisispora phaffii CBS 4417]